MKVDRTGEKRIMNCGMMAEIIEYKAWNDLTIKFENGYITKVKYYDGFKKGIIKNPYCPSVYNIGYLGETSTRENGKPLKSYKIWEAMIKRCYSKKSNINYPSYDKCEVCEEWLCYANFKNWYDKNIYEIIGENICLDKDILVQNNKIYSPETCIFVPEYINKLFMGHKRNYELPKGIYETEYKKYQASIRIKGKNIYLGTFDTIEEASQSYYKARLDYIKEVAEEYKDKIPKKLYNRLIEISNKIN